MVGFLRHPTCHRPSCCRYACLLLRCCQGKTQSIAQLSVLHCCALQCNAVQYSAVQRIHRCSMLQHSAEEYPLAADAHTTLVRSPVSGSFRFAVCTATTLCLLLCCFLQAQGSGSSQTPSQLRSGDMLWSTFLAGAAAGSSNTRPLPHIVDAAAPSTILFSSGTTVGSQWR